MQLRRRQNPDSTITHQACLNGVWSSITAADAPQLSWWFNLPNPPSGAALPVAPLSFRDTMLSAIHWQNSSRGYARRFLPAAFVFTSLAEKLFNPFPAFRVPALGRRQPLYYFGNALTILPSGSPIACPPFSRALDFELELGAVLAAPLRDASPAEAEAAIGGFVVINDWSLRDLQRAEMRSGFGPQKSKHFCSSMSETMVTADEILPRVKNLTATVTLNNHLVTTTSTAGMMFSWGEVLAHLSRAETLYPGELIASGTLPGGSGMESDIWLKSGDQLRLAIEGVSALEHTVQ